jgi:hypothetical protein
MAKKASKLLKKAQKYSKKQQKSYKIKKGQIEFGPLF